jgi:hypothetical protein
MRSWFPDELARVKTASSRLHVIKHPGRALVRLIEFLCAGRV